MTVVQEHAGGENFGVDRTSAAVSSELFQLQDKSMLRDSSVWLPRIRTLWRRVVLVAATLMWSWSRMLSPVHADTATIDSDSSTQIVTVSNTLTEEDTAIALEETTEELNEFPHPIQSTPSRKRYNRVIPVALGVAVGTGSAAVYRKTRKEDEPQEPSPFSAPPRPLDVEETLSELSQLRQDRQERLHDMQDEIEDLQQQITETNISKQELTSLKIAMLKKRTKRLDRLT